MGHFSSGSFAGVLCSLRGSEWSNQSSAVTFLVSPIPRSCGPVLCLLSPRELSYFHLFKHSLPADNSGIYISSPSLPGSQLCGLQTRHPPYRCKVAVPRHMDSSPASILACGFCGRPDSGDRAAELLLSDLALDSTFCLSVGKLELLHF